MAWVRLRYSTLVNYCSQLFRALTSVAFVVIVARKLPVAEFGLWGIILSSVALLSQPVSLWMYWARREIARGNGEASGSALAMSLAYLALALPAYVMLGVAYDAMLGWGLEYFIIAIPLLMVTVMQLWAGGVITVLRPEFYGYAQVVRELVRLAVGYALVAYLGLGLTGAIVAVVAARLSMLLAYLVGLLGARPSVRLTPGKLSLALTWLKRGLIPAVKMIADWVQNLDALVLSWASASEVPVAYLNAAYSSQRTTRQPSGAISPALYARLLAHARGYDVEETLRLVLLPSVYVLVTMSMLAVPIMSLLNPAYTSVHPLFIVATIAFTFDAVSTIMAVAATGSERIDIRSDVGLRELIGSRLFKAPLARLLRGVLVLLMGGLYAYYVRHDPLLAATGFPIARLTTAPLLLAYLWGLAKEGIDFSMPWREILAFTVAGVATATYYLASGASHIVVLRFTEAAPLLGVHVLVGGVIYLVVSYVLSPWLRDMLRLGLSYITGERPRRARQGEDPSKTL